MTLFADLLNQNKGLALAGLLLFSASLGCTSRKNQIGQEPILQVNDHTLTAQDFSDRLARGLKSFDALSAKDPSTVTRSKEDVLRTFMLESLILDYSNAHGISVSDAELDKEVNEFRSNYPDDVSFRKVLAEENLSLSAWRDLLRGTLLQRKVFRSISEKLPKPTQEEIQKSYEDNKEKFKRKERILLRQIVTDDLTKATELREAIKKSDFAKIATQFSVAPEAKNGGLVGWIEKGSVDIFDKAFSLSAGGTSQVLESPYGFHILRVDKKLPAGYLPLSEVRDLVEQNLLAQKEQAEFSGWLDRQIRASRVLKNNDLLKSIKIETRKGSE